MNTDTLIKKLEMLSELIQKTELIWICEAADEYRAAMQLQIQEMIRILEA